MKFVITLLLINILGTSYIYYAAGGYGGSDLFGAVSFPTSLDTFTNPSATDRTNSPSHATQHSNANDGVEALQVKVGIDGSTVNTTHDFKLSQVSDGDYAVSTDGAQLVSGLKNFLEEIHFAATTTASTSVFTATRPNFITSIDDSNGNELIGLTASSSAVNQLTITNAITAYAPIISVAGSDAAIDLWLKAKGAGNVLLGEIPHTWPDTDGTNGQVIQTNGSGVLSWGNTSGVSAASSTGTSLQIQTTAGDKILAWANGYFNDIDTVQTFTLKFDGITADTAALRLEVSSGAESQNYGLFGYYTATTTGTTSITVGHTGGGTRVDPSLMAIIL